jgi:sulfate transport system permease protein
MKPRAARMPRHTKRFARAGRAPLPGFGLALGFTLLYLSLLVLVPLAAVFAKSATSTWEALWKVATSPRTLAAFRLSLWASAAAAAINAVFGLVVAWVLERYDFPARRLVDALVDLPFALPTAVAGIALATVYGPKGWLGKPLLALGVESAFTPLGVVIALVFVGLPFVVRTVQPVLRGLDVALEEAAASLGASRRQTLVRVILPELVPALVSGCVLAFARALGEYGSVIFIAGNMPLKSEITPLLIMIKLEQFDYAGATTVASMFLLLSFGLLFGANVLAWRRGRRLAAPEVA